MSRIWMPQFGVFGCECVAKSLPLLQMVMLIRGDISNSLDVYQGCYNPGVGASAGSHDKGGPVDIGQFSDRQLRTERECGWGAQHRTRAQGFDSDHNHMFPIGCTHGSPLATQQQHAWQNGRNGLVSNGPITGPGPKGPDTPHWKEGVKKMEKEIMAFADDVAKKTADRVLDGMKTGATPAQVWGVQTTAPDGKSSWDALHILSWTGRQLANIWKLDIIPAPAPDKDNPNWTPLSYLRETLLAVRGVATKTDAQAKKLDALAADVTTLKNKNGA